MTGRQLCSYMFLASVNHVSNLLEQQNTNLVCVCVLLILIIQVLGVMPAPMYVHMCSLYTGSLACFCVHTV